ncbi:EamA family transporter [Kallotenue papyrolyticum]|uniref:EamA family transporter n=1 Tax=Kallotenue papyrolyticum TaxID=1325125 RepID=UPI0004785F25|nr:EamA family transporter [Kallotenue papyrolyticum]
MGMIGLIMASTLLGVCGQTVLKLGMARLGPQSISGDGPLTILLRLAVSPYVIGGLLLYVSGTFFWLVAMSRTQLSYLYPFASLSYVLLMIVAWALFREHIPPLRLLGALIICIGVVLVARSA